MDRIDFVSVSEYYLGAGLSAPIITNCPPSVGAGGLNLGWHPSEVNNP